MRRPRRAIDLRHDGSTRPPRSDCRTLPRGCSRREHKRTAPRHGNEPRIGSDGHFGPGTGQARAEPTKQRLIMVRRLVVSAPVAVGPRRQDRRQLGAGRTRAQGGHLRLAVRRPGAHVRRRRAVGRPLERRAAGPRTPPAVQPTPVAVLRRPVHGQRAARPPSAAMPFASRACPRTTASRPRRSRRWSSSA